MKEAVIFCGTAFSKGEVDGKGVSRVCDASGSVRYVILILRGEERKGLKIHN